MADYHLLTPAGFRAAGVACGIKQKTGAPDLALLVADRPRRPRLLSIYGGKLTSYRATAEKVLARLGSSLPERRRRALTSRLKLSVPENVGEGV